LFQICKQVVTRLLSGQYQDVFALLVPSCCDKSGTSCYHLVTRLMTVTDLLQVVPTRLIQTVRNKLLRACCHQLVNNLLRADDIRLVGTTTLLQDDNNLFQTCQQKLLKSCEIFTRAALGFRLGFGICCRPCLWCYSECIATPGKLEKYVWARWESNLRPVTYLSQS
jgi:hypothetical protein